MGKTVFVIFRGDFYDEGRLHGVAATREAAEANIKKSNPGVKLSAERDNFWEDEEWKVWFRLGEREVIE